MLSFFHKRYRDALSTVLFGLFVPPSHPFLYPTIGCSFQFINAKLVISGQQVWEVHSNVLRFLKMLIEVRISCGMQTLLVINPFQVPGPRAMTTMFGTQD